MENSGQEIKKKRKWGYRCILNFQVTKEEKAEYKMMAEARGFKQLTSYIRYLLIKDKRYLVMQNKKLI